MRQRVFHIASALVMLVLFSCRKETSIERPGSTNGTFMAEVNGSQWYASDSLKSASILGGFINLTGISGDGRQLSITLDDTIPGVYVLDQHSTSVAFYGSIDSSGSYVYSTNQGSGTTQAGGTVTVTQIDPVNHTISGTFSFAVFRDVDGKQLQLSEGVFLKLPYSSLATDNGNNTLEASIDGGKWSATSIESAAVSNQLIIKGSNITGTQSLGLNIPANISPGLYELDFTGYTYWAAYSPSPNVVLASYLPSSLEILENDVVNRRIRGNFSFNAVDPTDISGQHTTPRQVTEGHFEVTYQ